MTEEPIPHWPGQLVSLGDHEVFVRSVSAPGNPSRASQPPLSQPPLSQPP